MKKLQRGFTLIELLVVIAIIGLLSSIVLASLSSARSRGTDTAIQADLSNMRAQAELYATNNNRSYAGIMASSTAQGGLRDMVAAVRLKAPGQRVATSTDSASGWWVHASTTSGTWCVDGAGASKSGTGSTTATIPVCN